MVFGDYQKYYREISAFPLHLYEEIKEKGYVLKLSQLINTTPTDLLRIYGQINVHRIDSILNKKIIEGVYKKVDNEFNKIYEEHFSSLVERYDGSSLRLQIFKLMKQYLSYQPFPVEQAKCLRLYKIKVGGVKVEEEVKLEKKLTPYEFTKGLRKSYLERIEGIYKVFGGATYIVGPKLEQAAHGELAELKCWPLPSQRGSWRETIVAWSQDQEWGARVPGVEESVLRFLHTYFFSPFLEQRSEEKDFFVQAREEFALEIEKFSEGPDFEGPFSFRAYVIEKTIQDFFKHLFEDPNPRDLSEIKAVFSEVMKNEKKRTTFVYFFISTVTNYRNLRKNIAQWDYTPYQKTLKSQLKALGHLIFKDRRSANSQEKYKFYSLLFSCLLAIHTFEVCPAASVNDRRSIFRGICQMESSERRALYDFLRCQTRKPVTHVFSKLPFLRHHPTPTVPPSQSRKMEEFLKKYSFSEAEEARIKIQLLFFHSGLMTKMTEADDQGFQPIDFAFCVKWILNIQEICGFQFPANVVSYLLTWSYVDKKGIKEIKRLKDRLDEAKTQARKLISKDEGLFFISHQSRQYINEVISCVIPKFTFIPKNEAMEALCNCLQYTIYPHIAPSDFYPFIFLAFELSNARFNRLKDWGMDHLGMLRKLEPYQSALRVDTCWKEIGNEDFFQLHLTYFPSSHEPRSFHIENTLKISRERLKQDQKLCQILRIFSIFLADEFEPVKTSDLKPGEPNQQSPHFPEFPGYKIRCFEDVLSYFDNPIFSYLWDLYQADDKNEVGELIYEFFFQIKSNIRKKMEKIFSNKVPVESMRKKVLEGITYHSDDTVALIPLFFLDNFPQYGVRKKDYFAPMCAILRRAQLNFEFTWESCFKIEVENLKELVVDVKYEFTTITHCDHQQQGVELKSILNQRAPIERDSAPRDVVGILSRLETLEESNEGLIQTKKHKITFSCPQEGISFSTAYKDLLSAEKMFCWQIVMLKWKRFRTFYDREGLV